MHFQIKTNNLHFPDSSTFLRNKNSAFQTYATVPICFLFYATNPDIRGKMTLGTEANTWHCSLGTEDRVAVPPSPQGGVPWISCVG